MNAAILKFYEHIYDRQLIWHKRYIQKLPPLWSSDPIFIKYKFCNSFRELDKGTIYLIDMVINNKELSFKNKVFNIFAYRFFNVYGLFENFFDGLLDVDTFDFKHYEELLDKKIASGMQVFSDAYTTCQVPFDSKYRKQNKHVQMLLKLKHLVDLIDSFYINKLLCKNSPYDQVSVVQEIYTVGPFLAAQIYLDICYTKGVPFTGEDFVVIGPGAAAGLELVVPDMRPGEYSKFIHYLRDNEELYWNELKDRTGKDWYSIKWDSPYQRDNSRLSLTNIQHNLCEHRKYLNLVNPTRRSKKRYYKYSKENI